MAPREAPRRPDGGNWVIPSPGSTLQNPSRRLRSGGVWAFLPAYAQDGSVRAWALVDAADHVWASAKRWFLARDGYFYRNLSHRTEGRGKVALHREILGLARGDDREGDHINRDKLDNRSCNLRVATSSGNKQNAGRKPGKHGRGVHFHKNCKSRPWSARCVVGGRQISLGYFRTRAEAAEAARKGREMHLPYATD